MKVHRLTKSQMLPIGIDEAWSFFSNPLNLQAITPEDLDFRILPGWEDVAMYEGQIIQYKISVIPLYKMRWTTEIKHVSTGAYFVDEQRMGPYAFWHHKHYFKAVAGGVEVRDVVDYALPFGLLGSLAHLLFVKRKLRQIFHYREQKLSVLFPAEKSESTEG